MDITREDYARIEECGEHTKKSGFRVPFELDEYLVRYDISTDDAYGLMNGNGEIEICYPPDERMKDIKM